MDLIKVLAQVMPDLPKVSIEAFTGRGAFGDTWGPPVQVPGFVDQKRRLVRASNGSQVVSESTVYTRLGTACPPRSRVTLPGGHQSLVIAAHERDGFGNEALPGHLEIVCE